MVFFDTLRQHDRLGWCQATVNFDAQVHVITCDFSHATYVVDRLAHLGDVRLKIYLVFAFIEEWIDMAYGGEAAIFLLLKGL